MDVLLMAAADSPKLPVGETIRIVLLDGILPDGYSIRDPILFLQALPVKKQARKLQATLVRNYDPLTDSLTGVKCRAASVAKKPKKLAEFALSPTKTFTCFFVYLAFLRLVGKFFSIHLGKHISECAFLGSVNIMRDEY